MSMIRNARNVVYALSVMGLVVLGSYLLMSSAQAQMQMKQPQMVSLSGTIIDLTCASKGKAMMNAWKNTEQDHMMPDGKVQKDCATMCLKGGQPAALFSGGQITAVFACNPRTTLSEFAAQTVEVQGFWAGDGKDVKTFVPQKIRAKGSGSWKDVNCETMHM